MFFTFVLSLSLDYHWALYLDPLAEVQKITDTIKRNLEADIPHAEVLIIPRAQ